jgi:hypothetical protein
VLVLPPAAGLLAGFVVFAAIFLLGSSWLRILPPQDAEWLSSAFGARFGGIPRRLVLRITPAAQS